MNNRLCFGGLVILGEFAVGLMRVILVIGGEF